MSAAVQLPLYQCHKQVRAAEIIGFGAAIPGDGTRLILQIGKGTGYHDASSEWNAKHKPEIGGYLVMYDDGYTSYSPGKAFKDGYKLVE